MTQHTTSAPTYVPGAALTTKNALKTPARQAYELLHWGFVAAPVLAGIDKFFDLMTNWDRYLSPTFARLSPLSPHDDRFTSAGF